MSQPISWFPDNQTGLNKSLRLRMFFPLTDIKSILKLEQYIKTSIHVICLCFFPIRTILTSMAAPYFGGISQPGEPNRPHHLEHVDLCLCLQGPADLKIRKKPSIITVW